MRTIRPTTPEPKVHTTPARVLEGLQSEIWDPEKQCFVPWKKPAAPLVWSPDNAGGTWAMSGGQVLWKEA